MLEAGDIESAKEKFNRILEFVPDTAAALFYLGEIAFNNKDYEKAVQLFNQALESDGILAGPRYRLAEYALMQSDNKQARAYLVSEVELAPEDTEILTSLGSMFLKIGELDLATHCLLKAVENDSSAGDSYYYLGLASIAREEFGEAAKYFRHTLDIKPDYVAALRDSAAVYLGMGRAADACERIEKALSLAGDDPELKSFKRKIRQVQAIERIEKLLCRTKG